MSNIREMFRNGSRMAVRKNVKLLKYEHIIYSFEARHLENFALGLTEEAKVLNIYSVRWHSKMIWSQIRYGR